MAKMPRGIFTISPSLWKRRILSGCGYLTIFLQNLLLYNANDNLR